MSKYNRPFVALDGEGTQEEYVLLASSSGRWIGRKSGLSTEECLEFLLSLPRGSNSGVRPIYVWFAFDYDVNMILRDIPLRGDNSIETLKATNKLSWRGFRITYIRRKILRIRRGNRIHTSTDTWGFFQATFENALGDWGIETEPIISEGKAARDSFWNWSLSRLREYNNAELVALAQLAEKLREAAAPLELPIQSWHGPAALAGAWLSKNKIRKWIENVEVDIPPDLVDISARAYFGGRIDIQGYGIIEPVYHYDIVSAYPKGISLLPNLAEIEWIHTKTPVSKIYVARISYEIPETYWACFPWRSHNGTIRYPLEGEGWYWNYEIESAIRKYGSEYFQIKEVWNATGKLEYPFLDLIESAFAYRKQLKKQGHSSHRAIKLVLNSLYGKFAQAVGSARYRNLIWAGLITSYTRAQLLDALSDSVVCVMTDSLWSREPLDLDFGEGLGQWEESGENKLWVAEAGLYKATIDGENSQIWQRGFDKRNPVDIESIVSGWLRGDPISVSYMVKRFVGYGLALQSPTFNWRTWQEFNREIHPVPITGTTKRLPIFPLDSDFQPTNFQPLKLRPRDTKEISAPYSKLTADEQLILERLQDECEE